MTIELALDADLDRISFYDRHIPLERLAHCIRQKQVYVLRDQTQIVGVLRYSLFWQTLPFLDLLYLDEAYRGKGHGRQMMTHWETCLYKLGYRYAMLSTQADETAKDFYEKLGYQKTGAFLPPEQTAEELMYGKALF